MLRLNKTYTVVYGCKNWSTRGKLPPNQVTGNFSTYLKPSSNPGCGRNWLEQASEVAVDHSALEAGLSSNEQSNWCGSSPLKSRKAPYLPYRHHSTLMSRQPRVILRRHRFSSKEAHTLSPSLATAWQIPLLTLPSLRGHNGHQNGNSF